MKIYLASRSKARQDLLKSVGLRFKVVPVVVKERRARGNSSYAALVKANALEKAKAAAGKINHGLVIAADTVVVGGERIFGKPKNLKEARSMLKRLSRQPQWVYSGIAVMDKDKNKTLVDYEKSKVFLASLSEQEINAYFKQVSPFNKAGGFDIRNEGAFFLRRIEGCFSNVVGLPLHKLYLILRKLQVKVFLFLFTVSSLLPTLFLTGCASEYNIATNKEETFFYSTDREVEMGVAIDRQLLDKNKLADDPLLQKRVADIGQRIAAVCDRKDIDYHFKVLDDEEVNAVSLPGGFVYVNSGLIDKVANDDELAAVLAHEVGHIVARHSIKKLQGVMGYSLLRILTLTVPAGGQVGGAADAAFNELMLGYSREDELLADQLAVRYASSAGYNGRGMIDFLKQLEEINRRKPLRPRSYFKTHPYVPDRIRVVKEELGEKIGFTDYINTEQLPHDAYSTK
jgi:MAF protein